MDFRDEYKKEISELASEETAERIRNGVMDRLAEPEVTKKKPLPLRRIAVIGGSVAACLVIGVTALALTNGGKYNFAGTANDMMSGGNGAPTANTNGAVNPGMSRPEYNDANAAGGFADDEGLQDADHIGGSKDIAGDIPADTSSKPEGIASEQEPSSAETSQITLDGDLLTLDHGGETAVFVKVSDSYDSGSGNNEYTDITHPSDDGSLPIIEGSGPTNVSTPNNGGVPDEGEVGEHIEAVTSDGEKMFLVLRGDEVTLYNSEKILLGIYARAD